EEERPRRCGGCSALRGGHVIGPLRSASGRGRSPAQARAETNRRSCRCGDGCARLTAQCRPTPALPSTQARAGRRCRAARRPGRRAAPDDPWAPTGEAAEPWAASATIFDDRVRPGRRPDATTGGLYTRLRVTPYIRLGRISG